MRESVVEKYLKDKIEEYGGVCFKFTSPGTSGVPDRVCVMPGGQTFFIEVKRPGESPAKLQQYWIDKINELNGESFWVSTKKEIDFELKERGWYE